MQGTFSMLKTCFRHQVNVSISVVQEKADIKGDFNFCSFFDLIWG